MASIQTIASALACSIEPIALALIRGESSVREFVADLGWIPPDAPVPPAFATLADPAQRVVIALDTLAQRRDETTEGDLVSLYRGSPTGLEASPSWKSSLR